MKKTNFTTDELIEKSLAENDEEIRWQYVTTLYLKGDREVFEAAERLCESEDAKKIGLGADILGQLGTTGLPFKKKSVSLLLKLADSDLKALKKDPDLNALHSVIIALGKMQTPESLQKISEFGTHRDASIREGVAYGLSTAVEEDFAVRTLIELSADSDEDVRNWATFGLGQKESDTPNIREALLNRLSEKGTETRDEIRGEALVGLARRKDERVVEPLSRELSGERVGVLAVEAAGEFADQRLCEALLQLKSWWDVDNGLLDEAIKNCCGE